MTPLSLKAIAGAIGAPPPAEDRQIKSVSTDSRALEPDCLFVALTGERFDGHDYVGKALANGACMAVVSREGTWPDGRVLRVRDTREALLAIARLHRRSLPVKVVGITGSVGKTTTKEMCACVLSAGFPTLKTQANLNNEVGLSATLLKLEPEHRAAVLELGTDGPGQMAPLSRCAEPDIGILTGIGVSHIEAMGSREGIRDEKLALRDGMPDGAVLLLNGDDDLLREVRDARLRLLRFGIDNPDCEIRGGGLGERDGGTAFEIGYRLKRYPAFVPALGRHNVLDALAAFGAGVCLGIEPETAARALASYRPEGMRQRVREHAGFTVVEDCYNASPDSMRAALSTLGSMPCGGRRIAVLADMLELGAIAEVSHKEVGIHAANCGIDRLLCTGELSAASVEAAREAGLSGAEHFPDRDALFEALREILAPGDVVWVKASRGMHLEALLERLYKEIA